MKTKEPPLRPLPKMLGGVPVTPCREPMEHRGGLWQCMVGDDFSVWEFDLRSGQYFRAMEPEPESEWCDDE